MPTDPGNYNIITALIAFAFSLWGSVAAYLVRLKKGVIKKFSFWGLLIEMVISGFAGVLTYLICTYMHVPNLVTIFMVGMAGHSGASAIASLQKVNISLFDKLGK